MRNVHRIAHAATHVPLRRAELEDHGIAIDMSEYPSTHLLDGIEIDGTQVDAAYIMEIGVTGGYVKTVDQALIDILHKGCETRKELSVIVTGTQMMWVVTAMKALHDWIVFRFEVTAEAKQS